MTDPEVFAILAILATAFSPIIAIQVSRFLDDRNEKRGRQLEVYRILMTTRGYLLSPAHAEALNRITLEFSPKIKRELVILQLWEKYLDHLSPSSPDGSDAWATRRRELLVQLLHSMGTYLGYGFSETQIKNQCYLPSKLTIVEEEQEGIRVMVHELLEGKRTLPIKVSVADAPTQQQEAA